MNFDATDVIKLDIYSKNQDLSQLEVDAEFVIFI